MYILRSKKNGRYYVGQTSNLWDRLRRHNEGRVKATRGAIPWVLMHTERYETRRKAVEREREIKSKKSRGFIERLIDNTRGVAQPG